MTTLTPTRKRNDLNENHLHFPSLPSWLNEVLGESHRFDQITSHLDGLSYPAVNISDKTNEFSIEMAIPGMTKSDFNIELDNQILSISNETENETEDNNPNYTRKEFSFASFKRAFTLPKSVDTEKITANYENGILTIKLPKLEEAKKKPARRVEVD